MKTVKSNVPRDLCQREEDRFREDVLAVREAVGRVLDPARGEGIDFAAGNELEKGRPEASKNKGFSAPERNIAVFCIYSLTSD
jgi:hypothetical protein